MRRIWLALLCPVALSAQLVTRDTTIYTATRIRTAANGNVTSISVTKIAAPTMGKTDTVRIAGPRDSIAFYPRVVANPWHFTFDLVKWTGAGTKPADVAFPSLPAPAVVHDTVIKVRVDTVTVGSASTRYFYWKPIVFGDSIRWWLDSTMTRPSDGSSYPGNIPLPVRRDTVRIGGAGGPFVPGDSLPTLAQAIHVDNHVFLYAGGGVPAGNGVYLESSSLYLGTVNASTTGWQAWKYDRPIKDAQGYAHTTPPRLLGSIYPTQDAAALALYAKCCP